MFCLPESQKGSVSLLLTRLLAHLLLGKLVVHEEDVHGDAADVRVVVDRLVVKQIRIDVGTDQAGHLSIREKEGKRPVSANNFSTISADL